LRVCLKWGSKFGNARSPAVLRKLITIVGFKDLENIDKDLEPIIESGDLKWKDYARLASGC